MDLNCSTDIILENKRVKLAPVNDTYFQYLLPVALSQPDLLKYSPTKFGDEAYLRNIFNQAYLARDQKSRYAFVIFDKSKNQYAGMSSFGNISNENKRIEIGWTWLGKDYQRTGLNRNCKFLMLQYAFETLEFERVEFKTDNRNTQSKTAIEAIGAKYEGTLRSHTIMTDGHRRDTVYYSILKQEWPAIKAKVFKKLV